MSQQKKNSKNSKSVNNNNNNLVDCKNVSSPKKKLYNDAPKCLVPIDDPQLILKIDSVRQLLRQDFQINGHLYWIEDQNRVLTVDFEVRRFLFQTNLEVEPAVEWIKERLKWRKEMDIENARPDRFPIEFYQSAGVFEFKVSN